MNGENIILYSKLFTITYLRPPPSPIKKCVTFFFYLDGFPYLSHVGCEVWQDVTKGPIIDACAEVDQESSKHRQETSFVLKKDIQHFLLRSSLIRSKCQTVKNNQK